MAQGRQMRWMLGGLAAMSVALFAGEFAPPAEGPVAFRRDQIPLNADAMADLSRQLETMASGLDGTTATSRRGAAQMLALAMALDPANNKARELVAAYQQNRPKPAPDAAQLESNRSRMLPYLAWLESPEAGRDGQALADCLKDVLPLTDPKRPQAAPGSEPVEAGAWDGWIPNISAYEPPKQDDSQKPPPGQGPGTKRDLLLTHAQVLTLLWRKAGKDEAAGWILACAPLQMSAIKVGEPSKWQPPLAIAIGPDEIGNLFDQVSSSILNLLKKHHNPLPAGYRISISSPELELSILSKNRPSLSAAAAVLASSAVTGREPQAIILGQIDSAGDFKLPPGFWDQLQALVGKGSGQRLVLPAEASAFLPSLLALEKPGFFFEYEVLLAADFQQLLDLTAKSPDETLAKANAQFLEIRERLGTQDVRQYLTNRFVRQRLGEVLQEAPWHYSAKMLLIQGAGNRPTQIPRKVLAAELHRIVEPSAWIVKIAATVVATWKMKWQGGVLTGQTEGFEFSAMDISRIGQACDHCRTRIAGLERAVEKKDLDLMEHARKVASTLRYLDRAVRATRGSQYVTTVRAACDEFMGSYKTLHEILNDETGDHASPPGF